MRYIELSTTNLSVSALAFGCMSLVPEKAVEGKAAAQHAYFIRLWARRRRR